MASNLFVVISSKSAKTRAAFLTCAFSPMVALLTRAFADLLALAKGSNPSIHIRNIILPDGRSISVNEGARG